MIPLGTANVLSYHLQGQGVPAFASGVERLYPVHFRLGEWNNRVFILMAGAGFDGSAVRKIRPGIKRWMGRTGYIIAALSALAAWSRPPFGLVVQSAGNRPEHYRTFWCVVRRLPVYFPPFPHEKSWVNADSDFRVDIFTGTTRRALLLYLLGVASGFSGVSWFRISRWARSIDIEGETFGQMDGEPVLFQDDRLSVSSRKITLLFSEKGLRRLGRIRAGVSLTAPVH